MMMKKLAIVSLCACVFLTACNRPPQYVSIEGKTMGTSYTMTFELPKGATASQIQTDIDKRLLEINKSMSTYDDTATIMAFNRAKAGEKIVIDPDFVKVITDSKTVYQLSKGTFNPTVMPLVQLWGFGGKMTVSRLQSPPTDDDIAKAKHLVDFDSITVTDNQIVKSKDGVALDFSAIAKGYGVDVIADVLHQQYKINHYMVEIGGEIATLGKNAKGQMWQLGIDAPVLNSGVKNRETIAIIRQSTTGKLNLATSGNYRNSLVLNDIRYSHTIDPTTGKPIVGGAPSVTVVHDTTSLADAWATALTAMPYEKALQMAKEQDLAVLFVIHKDPTKANQEQHQLSDWQIVETPKMQALRAK